MAFMKNCWYAAIWYADLPEGKPVGRTIAGQRMVFWRTGENKVAALDDACPHRKAPLSLGLVKDDQLSCRYHGLAFSSDGKCSANPYGPLQDSLAVRAYPVELQDGMVWVWTGRADKADPALIPEVLAFTRSLPATAYVVGYAHGSASHKLFEDNLLDPGHADFLHPFLGGGAMSRAKRTIEKKESSLLLIMVKEAWAYPPMFRPPIKQRT
jgi:vanillate O-demethylase monooxygenase subunit